MGIDISIKQRLFQIAEIVHLRVFGHAMSDEMRKFLGNLSWSFFGGIVAAGIMFSVNILAGRWLGPEEYGRYSLVIALASILWLFMSFGLDVSSMHFLSKKTQKKEKKYLMSSTILIVCFFSILSSVVLLYFLSSFSSVFHLEKTLLVVAVFYAVCFSLRTLLDCFLRGTGLFLFQSRIKIFEALIILFSFLILFFYKPGDYRIYILSIVFGNLIYIFMSLFNLREYISFRGLSKNSLFEILPYGIYALLGAIAATITANLDKVLVAAYFDKKLVGVYAAYYTSSMLVFSQLTIIFLNVFFPFVSNQDNNPVYIFRKINKAALLLFLPSLFLVIFISKITMYFFGGQYPIYWGLTMLFAMLSVLTSYATILWWMIAARGVSGIKFTSFNGIISGAIFIFLVSLFRSVLSLEIVIISLIISSVYMIVVGNLSFLKLQKNYV